MPRRYVHIGTAGWAYDHWRGPFYPVQLKTGEWLPYYAQHFRCVEIDSSFYRLPSVATLRHWHDCVPSGFMFAVKASRYITHMKKLAEPRRSLKPFLDRVTILGDKLGPILFQLPPRWHVDVKRLAVFLKALSREHRYAMEFRDSSWFDPQVYELLAAHDVAFCIFDLAGSPSPMEVTADLVYIRLHGPGAAYRGSYADRALNEWGRAIKRWRRQRREVFCLFDNDEAAYAVRDAQRLQQILRRGGVARRGM